MLLGPAAGCAASEPSARPGPTAANAPALEVVGAPPDERLRVIELVDAALKKNGDLGAYGDLSGGLAGLARSHAIRITVGPGGYFVEAAPRSRAGHDVALRVDPRTLEFHDVAVGAIAPPAH